MEVRFVGAGRHLYAASLITPASVTMIASALPSADLDEIDTGDFRIGRISDVCHAGQMGDLGDHFGRAFQHIAQFGYLAAEILLDDFQLRLGQLALGHQLFHIELIRLRGRNAAGRRMRL